MAFGFRLVIMVCAILHDMCKDTRPFCRPQTTKRDVAKFKNAKAPMSMLTFIHLLVASVLDKCR